MRFRFRTRRTTAARLVACALVLATYAAAAAAGAPAATRPPAAAFGSLPKVGEIGLSPSGNLLAWSVDQGPKGTTIVIYDVASGEPRRTFPVGTGVRFRGMAWHDDETLLLDVSVAAEFHGRGAETYKSEFSRTIAVDVAGGKPRMLLMDEGDRRFVAGATTVAYHTRQPKTVVMASYDYAAARENTVVDTRLAKGRRESGWVAKLFAVDVRTGRGEAIASGTQFTSEWLVTADGAPAARSEWEPDKRRFRVLAYRDGRWSDVYVREDGTQLSLEAVSADGKAAFAIGHAQQERAKLWSIALDGSGAQVRYEDPQYDVESVLLDRFDHHPIGVWIGGPEPRIEWLDPEAGRVAAMIGRAFPGRTTEVGGHSRDGKRVLAKVSGPSHAPVWYLVDLTKRTADIVGEPYPDLVNVPLGEVKATSYVARDGTKIPAYLTFPPGGGTKNLPLVVLPHGGPEARDGYAFDWLVQFLATRGYAVLQPQFRGSTGFGNEYRLAGYRQWGLRMQDDVTDGAKALIADGTADPRRVCIVGWSYGGYAALAGATLTPELYACAISINGVSDLPAMLGFTEQAGGKDSDALAYWKEHIGSKLDPKLVERSPSRLAANVRAPILLLHGADDTIVPIAQSEMMARALNLAGKPFSFVKLPGEDHSLLDSESRTRMLQEAEKFLAQHLGPGATSAATAADPDTSRAGSGGAP